MNKYQVTFSNIEYDFEQDGKWSPDPNAPDTYTCEVEARDEDAAIDIAMGYCSDDTGWCITGSTSETILIR